MTKAESVYSKVNNWLAAPINTGKSKAEAFRVLKVNPTLYYQANKKPTLTQAELRLEPKTKTQPTVIALVGTPSAIATAIQGINLN